MAGENLIWHGSTGQPGTAEGQSQPNPALYLGDFRASQVLHSLQSTITANQATESRHYVVDSAQIGAGLQVHRFKWLCMVTGPNALSAARVESFDTATGVYKLDRPLGPSNAAIGNFYRLFSRGNVWPDVTSAQAATGDVRYRSICLRNTVGSNFANLKMFFRDLSAGAADCDRTHQPASQQPYLNRANDQTDLFNSMGEFALLGGPDGFDGAGGWQNPLSYAAADTTVTLFGNTTTLAVWLRRRIPAGVGFRRSVAIQLVALSTSGGGDPNPMASSVIMPYDIAADAPLPEGSIEPDRFVHVAGGVRLRGRATRGGGPEANRAVRWILRPGDQGTIHTDDDPQPGYATTDANGIASATFRAPESLAFAGEDAVAQMLISSGDELGDPQPRIALSASIEFGEDVSADLALPSTQQSYDIDPGPGFWPGIS